MCCAKNRWWKQIPQTHVGVIEHTTKHVSVWLKNFEHMYVRLWTNNWLYREKEAEKLYKIVCFSNKWFIIKFASTIFYILPTEVSKIICDYINPCFDIRHDFRETNKANSDIAIA